MRFAHATIQERIEPVVKVADRRPAVVQGELANLVVTPQWERYLHQVLDAYTDAADRDDEQGIGIWISGFFGSGKSLLMKMLGVLMEGETLESQPAGELFLSRLPATSAGSRRSAALPGRLRAQDHHDGRRRQPARPAGRAE